MFHGKCHTVMLLIFPVKFIYIVTFQTEFKSAEILLIMTETIFCFTQPCLVNAK